MSPVAPLTLQIARFRRPDGGNGASLFPVNRLVFYEPESSRIASEIIATPGEICAAVIEE